MKIDYSKNKLNKDANSSIVETEALTNFENLSIKPDSPVWKNEIISDNSMEVKPDEENTPAQITEEPVKENTNESQPEEPKPQDEETEKQKETETTQVEQKETETVEVQTESLNLETEKGSAENKEVAEPEVKITEEKSTATIPQSLPQLEHKPRIIVKHSILGNKIPSHDPNVLVESSTFTSVGKIQPFLITISSNAALVMDYHCHLTTSEVVGYLAGTWDVNTHNLNVTHAFPCKCRLGDYETAPVVESEIRKSITSTGLTVVGWYHSHPTAPATPSIRDIETQLDYQLRMKGNNDSTYLPCIGLICSPYHLNNSSLESNIVSYWVVPPPENKIHEYGKPMMMTYSFQQDQSISHDILLEMKKCADFYKPEKDYIHFTEIYNGPVSFLEKLKVSVTPKFPLNHQKSESFWNFLKDITLETTDKTETEILKQIIDISSTPSAAPPPSEKPKFNIPSIPPLTPLNFKSSSSSTSNSTTSSSSNSTSMQYHKSHSRSKSSGKRSSSRDQKNLASLSNYFVGSDLAALFGSSKFPGMGLDPATKSLLNLNSLSLGGMFLPPMAAAAAAAASYKPDPSVGLMKPPPPPSSSYYPYPSSRSSSNSRSSTSPSSSSSSRSQSRSIPSTSRDMPPPNKVPKLDVHQMANFFIPPNLGKNCTITNRPSTSTSSK